MVEASRRDESSVPVAVNCDTTGLTDRAEPDTDGPPGPRPRAVRPALVPALTIVGVLNSSYSSTLSKRRLGNGFKVRACVRARKKGKRPPFWMLDESSLREIRTLANSLVLSRPET